MKQEICDVLEKNILAIGDALKEKLLSGEGDAVRDMQYKIYGGINTDVNPGFAVAVEAAFENLPANLKANLPKSIEKKLIEMGLENKLKVWSNLRIETENVLKKEVGKKPLEIYENDYNRLFYLKGNSLRIGINGHRRCIAKELVNRERKPVSALLNRWGDRTSNVILGREEYLVIKDFDDKIFEFRQGFQEYERLSVIRMKVFVLGREVSIGDMAWNIDIYLPEMEVKGWTYGAEQGLWELLTKDMRDCPEGHLLFEESVKKLNERVEKEEERIAKAKVAEARAAEGFNLLFA